MRTLRHGRRAFTLIEIVIAVAIVALITVGVYGMVSSTMSVSRMTEQMAQQSSQLLGFNRYIQSHFRSLQLKLPGAAQVVAGKSGRSGLGSRADAVSWITPPGSAILARRAEGLYVATLEMAPLVSDKTKYGIYVARSVFEPDRPPSAPLSRALLLADATYLEIAFYDARINNWVDEWRDAAVLPDLVRVRVGTVAGGDHEVISRLPFKTQR